jgi:hypothetical protein
MRAEKVSKKVGATQGELQVCWSGVVAWTRLTVCAECGREAEAIRNGFLYISLFASHYQHFTPYFFISCSSSPKYFLYTHYNHKISFSIPTFYPLLIFHLLTIHRGHTAAVPNSVRAHEQ